ncbi:MAG: FHA domain-containing protein [Gemmatimonadaceae bacterium]|nr:FHA domain-containing protein [Gemmatimonadaceae bacterium]
MAHLIFGEQSRPLGLGVLSIGSGVEATWRIREPDLLRLHALVMGDGSFGAATISRASSDAEITVNGELLTGEPHRLQAGDVIVMGAHEFRYETDSPPEAAAGTGTGWLRDARRDRIYPIGSDVTTIGREAGAGILLQEPEVSRIHARVERDGDAIRLLPEVGALMLLNGNKVEKSTRLADGDAIGIGRTVLWFTMDPPVRRALETANAMRTDRYTRRVPTSKLGIVERREEREVRQRKLWQKAVTGLALALLAAIGGVLAWRYGLVASVLQYLG